MSSYSTFSDDFYVNLNLNTEMDLPSTRETVLHCFEPLQKQYPAMRKFYCRERGEFVLEEDEYLSSNPNYSTVVRLCWRSLARAGHSYP